MASVTLTWTAASPAPANGYRIKYWPTNSPTTISTISPNPIASPYTITGLTDNTQYSGTIEASCVGAAYSTAIAWNTIYIGNYYFATKFNCIGCTQVGTNVLVYSSTALTIGTYYKLGNFVYKIETAEPWDNNPIDISAYTASATTCATLCPSNSITINIYLNFATSGQANSTGQARLYTSYDGVNYEAASTVLTTDGESQSITPIPGNWYYLQVTKLTCTGNNCTGVRPQAVWSIDGQYYGPNIGTIANGSSSSSDPFQIASSGSHAYTFTGYVDFFI
jgi:hypothetical protein